MQVSSASGEGLSRRQVLAGAAAVGTAAAGMALSGSMSSLQPALAVPRMAILDEGAPVAAALPGLLVARVPRVERFRGDISQLWFGRMARSPAALSAPILGLTSAGSMYCIEELGARHGLRLLAAVYAHSIDDSVAGDAAWLRGEIAAARRHGNAVLALARGAPGMPAPGTPAERFARGGRDRLVAWIMAPSGANQAGPAKIRSERV